MKKEISSHETIIKGSWIEVDHKLDEDDSAKRINDLINKTLLQVAVSNDGWKTVYIDPTDFRFWELSYPDSEEHGAGAPQLRNLSLSQLKDKYGSVEIVIGGKNTVL